MSSVSGVSREVCPLISKGAMSSLLQGEQCPYFKRSSVGEQCHNLKGSSVLI